MHPYWTTSQSAIARWQSGPTTSRISIAASQLRETLSLTRRPPTPRDEHGAYVPSRPPYTHESRFSQFNGEIEDIQESAELAQKSVDLTTADGTHLPDRLHILAKALEGCFRRTGNLEYSRAAIQSLQMAFILVPDDHADRLTILSRLGTLYRAQFGQSGKLTDIRLSIASLSKAVRMVPDDHPDVPQLLNDLGISLQTSFYRTEEINEIEDSIAVLEKAIDRTSAQDSAFPIRLTLLGQAFQMKCTITDDLADIQKAVYNIRLAVKHTPPGGGGMSFRLTVTHSTRQRAGKACKRERRGCRY